MGTNLSPASGACDAGNTGRDIDRVVFDKSEALVK
jgi:hypothetical protein